MNGSFYSLQAVRDIDNRILLYHISNASIHLLSCFFIIWLLLPYMDIEDQTMNKSYLGACKISYDLNTLSNDFNIHSFSSDWEGRPCLLKYFDFVSVCVFVWLSTVISSIFGKSFHFPFPYFVFLVLSFPRGLIIIKNRPVIVFNTEQQLNMKIK